MKVACARFDDIYHGERSFLVELNKLWSNATGTSESYVAADSHHLVPIHMVTEKSRGQPFTLHKGLILFHLTVHARDTEFQYPKSGSFFATNPAHSLHILFEEKSDRVLNFGQIARLITYQLKRDVIVVDNAGDNIMCKMRGTPNAHAEFVETGENAHEGVAAGFYPRSWEARENFNEIRICAGTPEDNLIYLEEIEITPDAIQRLQHERLTNIGTVYNETIRTRVCPSKELAEDWTVVSNAYGLMYLYEFMRDLWSDEERLLLFHSKANVYVEDDAKGTPFPKSVVLSIPLLGGRKRSLYVKAWTSLDVERLWPMIRLMVDTLVDLRSDLLKVEHYEKLVLDDVTLDQLTAAGIDLGGYL